MWIRIDREVRAICEAEKDNRCEHPEKLKSRPGECTPEQIKKCHGDVKEHPCENKEKAAR